MIAAIEGILSQKTPAARTLENNVIKGNQFGLNGTDINGFDIAYDGNGTNNCFYLAGVTSTFPADARPSPAAAARTRSARPRRTRCSPGSAENALKAGRSTSTRPSPGYTPLEVFK